MVQIEGGTVFVGKADKLVELCLNDCTLVLQMDDDKFNDNSAKAFLDERVRGHVMMDDVRVLSTEGYARQQLAGGDKEGTKHSRRTSATVIRARSREDAMAQIAAHLKEDGVSDEEIAEALTKFPDSVGERRKVSRWQQFKERFAK